MIEKILLPIDLQETRLARKAVDFASEEALRHGAELFVLTVLPGFGMPLVASFFPDSAMEKATKEVAKALRAYVAETFAAGIRTVPLVAQGNPAEQIAGQAGRLGVDLIVIPSHAKGLEKTLLGSCASRVVQLADCSVMVVKG
ncbi:MAG: universal stress protein [Rhodocyclaceae bacterium]|nr:universal stress protein [Rhodocyclaceae bacterium]